MDVVERLALASQHPSPDSVRPDTEAFLTRVFPELGAASPPASAIGADRFAVGPGQAVSEDGAVQESREGLLDELREISRDSDGGKDGSRLRRIAEIVELLDGEEAACAWWRHAAQAGDAVALAVVEDIAIEQHHPGERPSVFLDNCSAIPPWGRG
ncbi:hypothetical protein [Streptomyces coffeae]|uniref:Uncharacterized protein n=1 Tax=Streptomyces coffeae TaxID=621382 RepID=A0ABS1NL14_9ACTN|nr:hypothetical protein [Streptomyces coffeae]MBL1100741.1 hypothetical protein [Streptomyces coffeae]